MVRVKMLQRNEVAVIDNGNVCVFDSGGRLIQENAGLIPKYTTGMISLPIISVLSSNGSVEVALFENDTMKRYATNDEAMQVAMNIQMQGKIVRMLRHDGQTDNVRYNQLLFVYAEGTNLLEKLSNVNVQEIVD